MVADGEQVRDVDRMAAVLQKGFQIFIEIDCGAGRGGVTADGEDLLVIGAMVEASQYLSLQGVLTHAGQSYLATDLAEIEVIAELERSAATRAAARLRRRGMRVPTVSVGSTPTALLARTLEGVTEMRPGVYMFFDLAQAALGVCSKDEIGLSVLTSVIGYNPRSNALLIDAGALALSQDHSATRDIGSAHFGQVCSLDGRILPGLFVSGVHQEHGFIPLPAGTSPDMCPSGSKLRILPNHACMTAAAYSHYYVTRQVDDLVYGKWTKATGW
jgi:D-serine deaminase-like pyridoxal phosphate-dependent protein